AGGAAPGRPVRRPPRGRAAPPASAARARRRRPRAQSEPRARRRSAALNPAWPPPARVPYNRRMSDFELVAPYAPTGDQPQAIAALLRALRAGERHQTLLGVTGSGKTFTMANVIAEVGLPTLVISHN